MDEVLQFLATPVGSGLAGVVIGGVFAVLGGAVTARATRKAAEVAADAQRDVAEEERVSEEQERRVRMAEFTFEARQKLVERLLAVLREQEEETVREWQCSWSEEDAVIRHRAKGLEVARLMHSVFSSKVTGAAESVVEASASFAQAHVMIDRSSNADRVIVKGRVDDRVEQEENYQTALRAFLKSVHEEALPKGDIDR
ncbi:hypothetical protein ACTXL6_00150 [Brachybacterium tyrofermentans]|uniref:hypothetical protein n=1 Tax=Brachybacterium tyrofermentans TaxID=47848 RepID=UPI003FD4DA48